MGKMVRDTLAAVETLSALEFIDPDRIYLLGYSLGATVGLYAASLDERIAGVVSVSGFSSFRLSTPEKERAHAVIRRFFHMHGLHPRLGLFLESPDRMPFHFHEVPGLIAPRPLLVVAPQLDWDHPVKDVLRVTREARKAYALTGAEKSLTVLSNYDINRWTTFFNPPSPQREVFEWIQKNFQ